jgi:hypothetical protein
LPGSNFPAIAVKGVNVSTLRNRPAPALAGTLLLAGLLTVAAAHPTTARAGDGPAKEDLNTVSLQVAALQTLHQLAATPAQLEGLAKLAKETAAKGEKRKAAKASEKFRKTLTDLRDALVNADEDKIEELSDTLDEVRDSEEPDLDDGVALTDEARRRAPDAWRLFTTRQTANFLSLYGDDIPDPLTLLLDALDQSRKLSAEEWKDYSEGLVEKAGWLLGGVDAGRARKAGDKVAALLEGIRALKDDELKAKRPDLEQEIHKLVETVGPTAVLRHILDHDMAELLSNPQLPAALEARLKNVKK